MKYKDEEIFVREMVEADLFYLGQYMMDPVVLSVNPMSNLSEVQDAMKVWQFYGRRGSVYTAEINHTPAGFAILYVNQFEKLKKQALFAMCVGEKYRGKGIGTKVLQHLMKQAKETYGIKNLHLEMYEGNPAYRLYVRAGFKEYGKHEKFLKEPGGKYKGKVLMQIDLESWEG